MSDSYHGWQPSSANQKTSRYDWDVKLDDFKFERFIPEYQQTDKESHTVLLALSDS